MMPVRDALSFENSYPLGLPKNGFQGDSYYRGVNLGAEALITYYVKDKVVSAKDQRTLNLGPCLAASVSRKCEHIRSSTGADNRPGDGNAGPLAVSETKRLTMVEPPAEVTANAP